MAQLGDGTYDAMVVDVSRDRRPGARLDLVITKGAHKGEVVAVRSGGMSDDPQLLGLPARLTVTGGRPQVHIDTEDTEPLIQALRSRRPGSPGLPPRQ